MSRRGVDAVVVQRMLRLVGLGVRARGVVVGVEQVRRAARKGTLAYAIVAADASANSMEKVTPLLNARRIKFVEVPAAAELGAAVGREQAAAVGITDPQLARGIRQLVESSAAGTPEEGV
ncbi:MAG TPA: ribosomal L7Ae/L30e/S12e/Gadd45 family protein [Gemmatimonadaceae bacterium]|nr:ribosomal L7Ae/L30e/S12e/Gadd45 family protein [Gemmatimonadaceae bacterium]